MLLVEVLRVPAVALPGVAESPQDDCSTFTVAGTVFIVVESSGTTAVLAVDEHEAGALVAGHQDLYEEVWSDDSEFVGVRVDLRRAPERRVQELVVAAWRNKAPGHLLPPPRRPR
jgi:hypothetical protein